MSTEIEFILRMIIALMMVIVGLIVALRDGTLGGGE